jgi:diacylglycerol kinase (ATP)
MRVLLSESSAIQIIATPGSGNGRALAAAARLREALVARGHDTALAVFPDLDALERWAATDRSRFSLLICVGGDGTLDTAVRAAVRRSVPFLAVASGFGNLFARALGQPRRVERALELLDAGEIVHVDVGTRNGRFFVCHESYGLLSRIQSDVEEGTRRRRGRFGRCLAYYRMALRHLGESPIPPLQVTVDGRVVARDAAIVTVANVETYGRWLDLTAGASPIDGLLDVFVMRRARRREVMARLVRRQLHLPGSEHGTLVRRGRRVTVEGPSQAREVHVVMPGRLPVVVSPETARTLERDLARVQGVARVRRVA